jgi:signal transduction histidine kinase
LQNLSLKASGYLDIGRKQCDKQEASIREILDTFSAEVESLKSFSIDPLQAPGALVCTREVVDALSPTFSLNQMNLQLRSNLDERRQWKVVGEKVRLEIALINLIENAFSHCPRESTVITVIVGIKEEGDFITTTVEDEGSGIEPEIATTLFQKFSQGKHKPGITGLGLYFCCITIERWGGNIGYNNRAGRGSMFWYRLPKLVAQNLVHT